MIKDKMNWGGEVIQINSVLTLHTKESKEAAITVQNLRDWGFEVQIRIGLEIVIATNAMPRTLRKARGHDSTSGIAPLMAMMAKVGVK